MFQKSYFCAFCARKGEKRGEISDLKRGKKREREGMMQVQIAAAAASASSAP